MVGIPIAREGFELAVIEGKTLLYSHDMMAMHSLNETAAVVWKLCDGERTVEEIVDLLSQAFPNTASDIGQDVRDVIGKLIREDVLQWSEK